jgi:hypothetical protein
MGKLHEAVLDEGRQHVLTWRYHGGGMAGYGAFVITVALDGERAPREREVARQD